MKKVLGLLFSALLVLTAFSSIDTAQAAHGRNSAAALGFLGGAAVGAAIANNNRGGYYNDCDAWGNCYQRRGYYRAAPSRGGLVYNDEKDCWVRRNNYWGPCRAY